VVPILIRFERFTVFQASGSAGGHDLKEYRLVVHCGGCMLTRREMLSRIQKAKEEKVPITNYGLCISFSQGVIKRVLSPFPAALDAFEREINRIKQAPHPTLSPRGGEG